MDFDKAERARELLAAVGLADEPTGNLDPGTSGEILDLLLGLRDEHGMTTGHPPESTLARINSLGA